MAVNGLRVVCDLSDFFNDLRSKSFMYIDFSKHQTIKDVIGRIQNQFCLKNASEIVLLVGDYFLPSSEDIRVLRDGDIIKVVKDVQVDARIIEGKKDKDKIHTPRTEENSFNHEGPQFVVDDEKEGTCSPNDRLKDMFEENGLDGNENCEIITKKKKKLGTSSPTSSIEPETKSHLDTKTESKVELCSNQQLTDAENIRESAINLNGTHSPGDELDVKKKSKKRSRIRKHKKNKINEDVAQQPSAESYLGTAISSCTTGPPFEMLKRNAKHIRFSNETHEFDNCSNINNSDSNHSELSSRVSSTKNDFLGCYEESKRETTQWDVISPVRDEHFSSNGYNDMPFEKILSLKNASPIVAKRNKSPKVPEFNIVGLPGNTSPLNGPPKENDIITYKILKMDTTYCPQISGFIIAKVLQYTPHTQQLSLEILDGLDHCQQPKGKFDMTFDSDMDTDVIDNIVEVNWQELLDARKCIL